MNKSITYNIGSNVHKLKQPVPHLQGNSAHEGQRTSCPTFNRKLRRKLERMLERKERNHWRRRSDRMLDRRESFHSQNRSSNRLAPFVHCPYKYEKRFDFIIICLKIHITVVKPPSINFQSHHMVKPIISVISFYSKKQISRKMFK